LPFNRHLTCIDQVREEPSQTPLRYQYEWTISIGRCWDGNTFHGNDHVLAFDGIKIYVASPGAELVHPYTAQSKLLVLANNLVTAVECSTYNANSVRVNTPLASHYNHSIISITMGRRVMHYPPHANSK